MTTNEQKQKILGHLIESLELPQSAYEKAEKRYQELAEWLGRKDSSCEHNDPHVFSQGSFRLGTAIRPLNEKEEYDLDLVCELRKGITKSSHTQQQLKDIIGGEIKKYRVAKNIQKPVTEKHRCLRLEYQDDLSFYMDILPSIPADDSKKQSIYESISSSNENREIASDASQLTMNITDNRLANYMQISSDWPISNPAGYALWFKFKMRRSKIFMEARAQVDELPSFKIKTPLQRIIQLLKRHRDQMFKDDPDVKPISIIITTLAANTYNGQSDIVETLNIILNEMKIFVETGSNWIPNPADPKENFADRWTMPAYKNLQLRKHFSHWVIQAQSDFELITNSLDMNFVNEQALTKLSVKVKQSDLTSLLGLTTASTYTKPPKIHAFSEPAKPWANTE